MRVPGLVVADDRLIETIRSDASLERVAIRGRAVEARGRVVD
jgi:hypothetical protein